MSETARNDHLIDAPFFSRGAANTLFSYLYRDADNYKQAETVVLPGALSLGQAHAIADGADEEDGFVPSAVGLDDLQGRASNGWQSDTYHPFHEIAGISLTDDLAAIRTPAAQLLALFLAADWTVEAHRVEVQHAFARSAADAPV